MTPGTKVRTKVDVVTPGYEVPGGSVGAVRAVLPVGIYPIEVSFDGLPRTFQYRSDELEAIE